MLFYFFDLDVMISIFKPIKNHSVITPVHTYAKNLSHHKWVCLRYHLWPGDSSKFIEHGRTWEPMDHHWHIDWSCSIGLPSYYETQARVE